MLGMTSVPFGPRVAWSAAISSAGPPSTGLTFEKAQWTSSTPLGCTPRAWSWAISWVGETGWAGMRESYHSPHQSRNSGGRKTQGFQKVEKPCRAIGEEPSLPPSSAKIVRRKGSIFFSTAALPLWKPQTPKSGRDFVEIVRKTPTAALSLWNERELYGFQPRRLPSMCGREMTWQVRRLISARW